MRKRYLMSMPLSLPQLAIAMYHQRSRELVNPPALLHDTIIVPVFSRDHSPFDLRTRTWVSVDDSPPPLNNSSTSSRKLVSFSSRLPFERPSSWLSRAKSTKAPSSVALNTSVSVSREIDSYAPLPPSLPSSPLPSTSREAAAANGA